jgi:predicted dehydrogenase
MMRIGILSFAHLHAEAYAQQLLTMPDVEFIGLADDNQRRGGYFAEQLGVHAFESVAALLAAKPDAVIVASENARHLMYVQQAAEAGAHILCEKPLATTVDDAKQIVQICRKQRVKLMTAFPMRFSSPAVEIKQMMGQGGLGRIYGINSTNQGMLPELHQAENLAFLERNWFVDKALAGGGALTDHIVHLADLLRWYLQQEVTEVYALSNQILHRGKVQVETGGLVMLTFADGTFASIDCSWNKPASYPTWGGLTLELVAEQGLVVMDAFKQGMTVHSSQAGRPAWHYWGSDANYGMLREFINAIREDRLPMVTGEDGLRAVEIVAAAYESVTTGQPALLTPA